MLIEFNDAPALPERKPQVDLAVQHVCTPVARPTECEPRSVTDINPSFVAMSLPDDWFEVVEVLPNARVRLIVLPHAGSMPQAYFKWAAKLAPLVETVVGSYPERGLRNASENPPNFSAMVCHTHFERELQWPNVNDMWPTEHPLLSMTKLIHRRAQFFAVHRPSTTFVEFHCLSSTFVSLCAHSLLQLKLLNGCSDCATLRCVRWWTIWRRISSMSRMLSSGTATAPLLHLNLFEKSAGETWSCRCTFLLRAAQARWKCR